MDVWRLIPLLEARGAMQMAIDRWLFEQHCQGLHPPALRFYTWSPVAISLGYHQRHWPLGWQEMTWAGRPLELVRRPTGGRAVLHQGDLTYAVITSGLPGNRTQVYQQLCEFLIVGWQSLGVVLQFGQAGRGYIQNPNCFGTATAADLVMADGTKLIGSAQLWQRNTVLQHGSIRLEPDETLFSQVFAADPSPLPRLPLPQRGGALQRRVMEALVAAADRCFGVQLVAQPLTEKEWYQIEAAASLDLTVMEF